MFFSLFRQREETKRDHVARSGQNKSDSSKTVLRDSLRSNRSSHCLRQRFSVLAFVTFPLAIATFKAPLPTSPHRHGARRSIRNATTSHYRNTLSPTRPPRRGGEAITATKSGSGTLVKERREGAVASSPYRGRPWRGWMLLCFFLRAEERKKISSLDKESRD